MKRFGQCHPGWLNGLVASCAVVAALGAVPARAGQPEDPADFAGGHVMQGWRTFHDKGCVDCHAIWGQGGNVGPDLGRIRTGRLTAGQLAGVMWNHIPKMLGQMQQTGRPPTVLTRKEMADLFALIFFVRQLDDLGNPARGEEILRAKGCSQCHETGTGAKGIGPDLAKWAEQPNPIIWAQMMWEHAPMMAEAMKRAGVTWPQLEGSDLTHIIAYIRSVAASGEKNYLRPGSAARGEVLFTEKKCNKCHPGTGPDLATADLPTSVGALASRMWNHSPAMTKVMEQKDVSREPISAQELADIIAYVLALGNMDRGGRPDRGEQVFVDKKCVECHDRSGLAKLPGPPVAKLSANAAPVEMATAMWNHGERMLQQLTEAGLPWPVFQDKEMVDLIAYLRSVADDKGTTKNH